MADAAQQPSDRRLAVDEQKSEDIHRYPFLLTDDLRGPIDDLQRLRDAEVKTREIIQKYQAAMREMMVRFEILDQDLNLKKHRNPIHHLESRIKKPASIFEKLERYGKEPQSRPDPRHAVDFIIEEVRKHPGEITIAEIGPCSNLALAVLKAPDIVPLIKRVIFMGGSFFKPGNVTPTAEFNWWFDPEAAHIVVRTPFREQIMVGLDVCEKMPFTFDRYQAFLAGQRPEMKKLLESTYAGQQFAKDEAFSQYVWDVLAAAILIDPSLITEERTCAVDVNAEFGPSYGQALAYPDNGPQGSQKARIVMTIDQERFWNMLTAR